MRTLSITIATAIAVALLLGLYSCGDRLIVADTVARVQRLELRAERLNQDIITLYEIILSLNQNNFVLDVVDFTDEDNRSGKKIIFSDGREVKIYHGDQGEDAPAPNITVEKHPDGQYYWVVNGNLVKDEHGQPLPATLVKPKIEVDKNGGYWKISYDGGKTWERIEGSENIGGGFGEGDIDVSNEYITLHLPGGVTVEIPIYVPPVPITAVNLSLLLPRPTEGATPVVSFTNGREYSGIVQWTPSHGTFRKNQSYIAAITLTPGTGYLFPDSVTVRHEYLPGAVDSIIAKLPAPDNAKARIFEINFPPVDNTDKELITVIDLTSLLPKPTEGATPVVSFIQGLLYSGVVHWLPSDPIFLQDRDYTATVTLIPAAGYYFPDSIDLIVRHKHMLDVDSTFADGTDIDIPQSRICTIHFPVTSSAGTKQLTEADYDLTLRFPQPQEGRAPITTFEWFSYTGRMTWKDESNPTQEVNRFERGRKYSVEITLSAKPGFTLDGVPPNTFHYDGADTVKHPAGQEGRNLRIDIKFPQTVVDAPVNDLNLTLKIPKPVMWETPVTKLTTTQYSFDVTWDPTIPQNFEASRFYTATVTLTATTGYTFKNVNGNVHLVTFIHNGGQLATTYPADPADPAWDGKKLTLTIGFPITGASQPTMFSGRKGNEDSAIDLIKATATGQNSLFVTIGSPLAEETVTLTVDEDLDTTGLILANNGSNTFNANLNNSPSTLTIDGAGLTVDLTGTSNGHPLITVGSGITLTLQNITFKGLRSGDNKDGNNNNTAPVIKVASGGKLTLGSGAIIGYNNNSSDGGGIVVDAGGELIMLSGAEVSDNTAGGGVYVTGKFTMSGGRIHHNKKDGNGGGVYVDGDNGDFILEGGDINNNEVTTGNGGGVAVRGASFTITTRGGNISDNKAQSNGGGVYVLNPGSRFFMDGGSIRNNTATGNGGGVYTDGEVEIFTMNYVAIISGNTATGNGGGVYTTTPFVMNRGTIGGNTATGNGGGGVYVASTPTASFTMNDGSVRGNKVTNKDGNGGGVYVSGGATPGKFLMSGGTISGNGIWPGTTNEKGNGKGAGVYVGASDPTKSETCGVFEKTGGTIHGALNRTKGDEGNGEWENAELQNYYRWPIETAPSHDHYAPNNDYTTTPGGEDIGYAVYLNYTDTEGGTPRIFKYNETLTRNLSNQSEDEGAWKGPWFPIEENSNP